MPIPEYERGESTGNKIELWDAHGCERQRGGFAAMDLLVPARVLCRRTWFKRDEHFSIPIMRLETDFHGERTGNERTAAYLLDKMGYPCAT